MNTEANPLTPSTGFGCAPQELIPPAERSPYPFVASALMLASVALMAVSLSFLSPPAALNMSPAYRFLPDGEVRPGFVCNLVALECSPMYFDQSRPEIETLIAVRSLPRVITMDLRFRQDESGNLILRIYDDNLDHPWRDARLADLTEPHFDSGVAKQRAYRGRWSAGTNFNSRLIGQYAGEQRKVVAELDRPRMHDLTQPVRANFFVTAALPTLTDAPLLDLMELQGNHMQRANEIFARNHRIRQGQSL